MLYVYQFYTVDKVLFNNKLTKCIKTLTIEIITINKKNTMHSYFYKELISLIKKHNLQLLLYTSNI